MIEAAEHCIATRRHVPAMVLMYALMDSLAWAGDDRRSPNLRTRFEAWVGKWLLPLLPASTPPISATDLYGARCGVLHTGTGVSDLYRRGEARRFLYAWGTAEVAVLEYGIANEEALKNHVALHYDALFNALQNAVDNFLSAAENDPVLAARLEEASSIQYMRIAHNDDAGEPGEG
jgi:hypothetical protein